MDGQTPSAGAAEGRDARIDRVMDEAQEAAETFRAAYMGLLHLGWSPDEQLGIRAEGGPVQILGSPDDVARARARLRADGVPEALIETLSRPALLGPWAPASLLQLAETRDEQAVQRVRRHGKPAAAKTTTPASAPVKKARKATPTQAVGNDPLIRESLFADPLEDLRYQVRHFYLVTVPVSQREEFPLAECTYLPSFIDDLPAAYATNRQATIRAIVDVLIGRVAARAPHRMRTHSSNGAPYLVREDGAKAWRASVQNNTPQALRINWWVTTDGRIELARIAQHDDYDIN